MVEAGEEVVADNKEEEGEDILCVEDNTAIPMATVHTIVPNVRPQELLIKTMLPSPT